MYRLLVDVPGQYNIALYMRPPSMSVITLAGSVNF